MIKPSKTSYYFSVSYNFRKTCVFNNWTGKKSVSLCQISSRLLGCMINAYVNSVYAQFFFWEAIYLILTLFPVIVSFIFKSIPSQHYLFKVNNWSTRKTCGRQLTTKIPEWHQLSCFGILNVTFEHILHFFLAFLLLSFKK